MDKDLFVEKLRLLAPAREDFLRYDVSDAYIDQFIKSYQCTPKLEADFLLNNDMVLSLLSHYDCSRIVIGTVNLIKSPIERINFYQIGTVDIDVLALNKISLEIEVLDHDDLDHTIWKCASNSSNFLNALLLSAEYFTSLLRKVSDEVDTSVLFQYVNLCAAKAGGEKYIDFYKVLLGYFD